MPCVIAHAVMSCVHHMMQFMAWEKLLIGLPFMPAKQYSSNLKYENQKPEHAENTSHCHA